MKEKKITKKEALHLAFEMCILVVETTGNVIASCEGGSKEDHEYHNKATKYINWYKQQFKPTKQPATP